MSQFQAPPMQPGMSAMQPHRGTMILVFGILSLVIGCIGVIFGIMAWVMGNADLKEMDAGRMDPTGRGTTQAGKICGIISVVLHVVGIGVWLFVVLVVGAGAIAGAASSGSHP